MQSWQFLHLSDELLVACIGSSFWLVSRRFASPDLVSACKIELGSLPRLSTTRAKPRLIGKTAPVRAPARVRSARSRCCPV